MDLVEQAATDEIPTATYNENVQKNAKLSLIGYWEPALVNGATVKLPYKPLDPSILLEFV